MFPFVLRLALWLCLLAGLPAPAFAAVEIAFHSRELGGSFPHAFVRLSGTIDSTGEPVDIAYGFTARAVSPAILFGPVRERCSSKARRGSEAATVNSI